MRALRSSQVSPVLSMRQTTVNAGTPRDRSRSSSSGAPLRLRLRVFLTRGRLDRQIRAGHPFEEPAELALRARQLADPRTQLGIARNLRGIIRHADRYRSRRSNSTVVIEPSAVRKGRHAIVELAEQLERGAAVNPRGILLAQTFLTDSLSPLFDPYSERIVAEAAREIQDGLEASPTIAFDVNAA
jgi:hypothetical protein